MAGETRAGEPPRTSGPVAVAPRFEPLPLGSIKPAGWLKEQLRIQADGLERPPRRVLARHQGQRLDRRQGRGLGARPRTGSTALVPLAYLLDDPALKAKVKTVVDYILDHQHPDGWLGPVGDTPEAQAVRRLAAVPPVQGAHPVPGGHRRPAGHPGAAEVLPQDRRGHRRRSRSIAGRSSAAPTSLVSLYWLHDRTGEPWLLDLADKAFAQSLRLAQRTSRTSTFTRQDAGQVRARHPRRQHGHGPEVRRACATA